MKTLKAFLILFIVAMVSLSVESQTKYEKTNKTVVTNDYNCSTFSVSGIFLNGGTWSVYLFEGNYYYYNIITNSTDNLGKSCANANKRCNELRNLSMN